MSSRSGSPRVEAARAAGRREPAFAGWHVHWFRRVGDDPYSSAVLYACRCGVIRPGF